MRIHAGARTHICIHPPFASHVHISPRIYTHTRLHIRMHIVYLYIYLHTSRANSCLVKATRRLQRASVKLHIKIARSLSLSLSHSLTLRAWAPSVYHLQVVPPAFREREREREGGLLFEDPEDWNKKRGGDEQRPSLNNEIFRRRAWNIRFIRETGGGGGGGGERCLIFEKVARVREVVCEPSDTTTGGWKLKFRNMENVSSLSSGEIKWFIGFLKKKIFFIFYARCWEKGVDVGEFLKMKVLFNTRKTGS